MTKKEVKKAVKKEVKKTVKKVVKKAVKKETKVNKSDSNKQKQTELVTKDMTLGELIGMYPETLNILLEKGIHCVGCGAANWETIEQGLSAHGMENKDVDKVVNELNTIALKQEARRNSNSIVFTNEALKEVKNLLKQEKKTGYGLRIEVLADGCCGTQYNIDFEKEKKAKDVVIALKGLNVFVDPKSMKMLKGSIVDYINTPAGSGFKIDNPNIVDDNHGHGHDSCSC